MATVPFLTSQRWGNISLSCSFPNPTNSRLSLNSEKDYNIEVFDLTGRKIMEAQGNNLDMSNLSKATYIVKAFDKASKETYSYKVIRN